MTPEFTDFLLLSDIPQLDRPVVAGGGQGSAVGGKRDDIHITSVPFQGRALSARGRVPHLHLSYIRSN